MNTYIAVDIGASSGRLISAHLDDNKIQIEEEHRFRNEQYAKNGFNRWNTEKLFIEILTGLEKIHKKGITECSLGIDTWAVDYALIDDNGEIVDEVISYRDDRTQGAIEDFTKSINKETIYNKTGIQFQPFNTLFQLYVEENEKIEKTKNLLLIPDYLSYRLTGKKIFEKTNASTTQLINVETGKLDEELLDAIGIDAKIFPDIVEPGTSIGYLNNTNFPEYELPKVEVLAVASHDTASAVLGTPGEGDDWAFLSSGTWSLLGMELNQNIVTEEAYLANYTNEAGAYGTNRFLKNIIGMWLVQEVSRNLDYKYSYEELAKLAENSEPFQQIINVNDVRFLNPDNMIDEIKKYCEDTNQIVPDTIGQIVRCIYDSLALKYKEELSELSNITNKEISSLIVVGGGRNISLLNQTIANEANIKVIAGPSESTALGNILVQMIAKGEVSDIQAGRELIKNTFSLIEYLPE